MGVGCSCSLSDGVIGGRAEARNLLGGPVVDEAGQRATGVKEPDQHGVGAEKFC